MKTIIQYIVQKRNPAFQFDTAIDNRIITQFIMNQTIALLRGLKIILKGKNPKGLLIGKKTKWLASGRIKFGTFLKLGDNVTLSGLGREGLTIGNNVGIGSYSQVIVSTSLNNIGKGIKIGNNVRIGANCVVTCDVPDNATIVMTHPRIILKKEAQPNKWFVLEQEDYKKH